MRDPGLDLPIPGLEAGQISRQRQISQQHGDMQGINQDHSPHFKIPRTANFVLLVSTHDPTRYPP